jgi:hypothetical protein
MTPTEQAGLLLLGVGGVSGNELLIVFLPFLLAAGFLGWVLLTMVNGFRSVTESLAGISRSLEKMASRD